MNCAVEFSAADFPGYHEAARRESLLRRAACVSRTEIICGLEVLPLNAQHVSLLLLTCSPFMGSYSVEVLCKKPDILDDIMRFLWIVSPMHSAGSKARLWRWQRKTPRDKFNEAFAPIMAEKIDNVVGEIVAYVNDAYIDADEPGENSGPSYFSEEIAIAYELSRYHGFRLDFWRPECPPEKNPLLVPLKIVFQLRKVRRNEQHGSESLSNRSDKLIEAAIPAIGERFRKNSQN